MKPTIFLLLLFAMRALLADPQFDELRSAAEAGDPWAQLNLGAAYDNGLGINVDAAKAVHWYRRAAEQGIGEAQFNLGHSYATGHGVQQDYREAVVWLERAALQGLAEAQHLLAVCYYDGLGVKRDQQIARHWLRRAVAQHYPPALDYAQRNRIVLEDKE